MTERPILFSAPMVRAILDGRKTQTRRVVKPQAPHWARGCYLQPSGRWTWVTGPRPANGPGDGVAMRDDTFRCPYGVPGDRLWVRESWTCDDEDGTLIFRADLGFGGDADDWERGRFEGVPRCRWRPSIHMPRWASRILLEVTAVRIERLWEISPPDAEAEGIVYEIRDPGLGRGGRPGWGWAENEYAGSAVHGYELLWESINGPGSWNANPWVWVVEFRRIEP